MIYINSKNYDPVFNLAAEEYLLKNTDKEVFMLWVSEPAVIVGKHQNTYAEINYPFIKEKKIKVARRLSGGGAVYHDRGNINFSYIQTGQEGKLINFKKFIDPVVNFLNDAGIAAFHSEKNDILIDGKKVSGNAEHVFKKRILHHGTLLYNSEINYLNKALHITPGKYKDKAVQSKRSSVTNISQFIKDMNIDTFREHLSDVFKKNFNLQLYEFSQTDLQEISVLKEEKYSTWKWVYGYSPAYIFDNNFIKDNRSCTINLNVEKGKIVSAIISGDLFYANQSHELSEALKNKNHEESDIVKAMLSLGLEEEFIGEIINHFF